VIVVVPYKVTIDETGNRNRAKLDEAKEEEEMETSFLSAGQSRGHHDTMKWRVVEEIAMFLSVSLHINDAPVVLGVRASGLGP